MSMENVICFFVRLVSIAVMIFLSLLPKKSFGNLAGTFGLDSVAVCSGSPPHKRSAYLSATANRAIRAVH